MARLTVEYSRHGRAQHCEKSSTMFKQAASGGLASLLGSTYERTIRLLAHCGLLDDLFEHRVT